MQPLSQLIVQGLTEEFQVLLKTRFKERLLDRVRYEIELDPQNRSPFHHCVEHEKPELLKALLHSPLKPLLHHADGSGKQPWELCATLDRVDCLGVFLEEPSIDWTDEARSVSVATIASDHKAYGCLDKLFTTKNISLSPTFLKKVVLENLKWQDWPPALQDKSIQLFQTQFTVHAERSLLAVIQANHWALLRYLLMKPEMTAACKQINLPALFKAMKVYETPIRVNPAILGVLLQFNGFDIKKPDDTGLSLIHHLAAAHCQCCHPKEQTVCQSEIQIDIRRNIALILQVYPDALQLIIADPPFYIYTAEQLGRLNCNLRFIPPDETNDRPEQDHPNVLTVPEHKMPRETAAPKPGRPYFVLALKMLPLLWRLVRTVCTMLLFSIFAPAPWCFFWGQLLSVHAQFFTSLLARKFSLSPVLLILIECFWIAAGILIIAANPIGGASLMLALTLVKSLLDCQKIFKSPPRVAILRALQGILAALPSLLWTACLIYPATQVLSILACVTYSALALPVFEKKVQYGALLLALLSVFWSIPLSAYAEPLLQVLCVLAALPGQYGMMQDLLHNSGVNRPKPKI